MGFDSNVPLGVRGPLTQMMPSVNFLGRAEGW